MAQELPDGAAQLPIEMLAQADPEAGRAVAVGAVSDAVRDTSPEAACFRCHGIDGEGDAAAVFPRLTGQAVGYLYRSLEEYASGERENAVMTPIAQALTVKERADVSAYYARLEDAPYAERPDVASDLLQFGAALAATGSATSGFPACVNCHGPDGTGLPPNYPYLAGQYASYLAAQLRAWRERRRGGGLFGVMAGIARRMTDREIDATAAYYASIRPMPEPTALAGTGLVEE